MGEKVSQDDRLSGSLVLLAEKSVDLLAYPIDAHQILLQILLLGISHIQLKLATLFGRRQKRLLSTSELAHEIVNRIADLSLNLLQVGLQKASLGIVKVFFKHKSQS